MKLRNKKTGGKHELNDEERDLFTLLKKIGLLEDWEIIEEKEPLINDKDVRNIIRYIASTYGSDQVYVTNFGMGDIKIKFSFENAGSTYLCFSLNTGIHVPDGLYTITELCGEEE